MCMNICTDCILAAKRNHMDDAHKTPLKKAELHGWHCGAFLFCEWKRRCQILPWHLFTNKEMSLMWNKWVQRNSLSTSESRSRHAAICDSPCFRLVKKHFCFSFEVFQSLNSAEFQLQLQCEVTLHFHNLFKKNWMFPPGLKAATCG